ncbi:MAG: glycosyltransferase family 2 protein [Acidobacteria bacterium]|nr:glycosyltransferase family 2 protein [Acidobacteriota bacterium]MBI3263317.1 glycosyltransferase family 2 protein [Acidobacteriota bacterium]
MPKLSVTIITINEEHNLEDALQSVAWADEIVIVDSGSTDQTREIARRFTDHVLVREWPGYSAQKNFAAGQARHDWILSLDADERVTNELAADIKRVMSGDPDARGYRMPRVSQYLGTWLRSTDWYPDYQLRLYDRRHGRWNGRPVHESVAVDGPVGMLRHELQHLPYRDISHHLQTIDRYTTLAAQAMFAEGRRTGVLGLLFHPLAAFLRNSVLRRGLLDGSTGLTVSALNSYYVFLKLAKLRELQGRHG